MAELGCGTKCLKYLFFLFNFIFMVLGIAILALGIYFRVDGNKWEALMDGNKTLVYAANIFIAAGIIVMLIGFLGCCGACKQYEWMLIAYSILVVLIFILEIAAGIFAYVKRDSLQASLTKGLGNAIKVTYSKAEFSGVTKAVDWFQKKLECCGAAGPVEYASNAEWLANGETIVPESCCGDSLVCKIPKVSSVKATVEGLIIAAAANNMIYSKGCVEAGKSFVKDNLWVIGGAGIGIAVVQLLGIIFACCLCKAFKDGEGSSA